MLRRFAVVAFAVVALAQTGCHGRISAFFYRITHCGCCTPYYGAPAANYGAPGCCTSFGATAAPSMPVSYQGTPVFTTPQPMTGNPMPTAPMPEKK